MGTFLKRVLIFLLKTYSDKSIEADYKSPLTLKTTTSALASLTSMKLQFAMVS